MCIYGTAAGAVHPLRPRSVPQGHPKSLCSVFKEQRPIGAFSPDWQNHFVRVRCSACQAQNELFFNSKDLDSTKLTLMPSQKSTRPRTTTSAVAKTSTTRIANPPDGCGPPTGTSPRFSEHPPGRLGAKYSKTQIRGQNREGVDLLWGRLSGLPARRLESLRHLVPPHHFDPPIALGCTKRYQEESHDKPR